ncbi:MAG: hypothetical protein EHM61_03760 [Acidobacteria bacterium]|nr:MAG: hypothetical protein EHM61_03760 [Acidobacteriota bacterium]
MTNRKKTTVLNGRQLAVFLVLFVQLSAHQSAYGLGRKDKFWENADLSSVLRAVRDHRGGVSEPECEELIRLNYKYLYFNALQTDRFIAMPKPERVLERMSQVFAANARLKERLEEARRLSGMESVKVSEFRQAARKIGDCAKALHDAFHDFFKEDNQGSYAVEPMADAQERAKFLEYLASCDQISALLNDEIERYFLNPSPGVVEISIYRSCSIPVLSLSLQKLSTMIEKTLPQ